MANFVCVSLDLRETPLIKGGMPREENDWSDFRYLIASLKIQL